MPKFRKKPIEIEGWRIGQAIRSYYEDDMSVSPWLWKAIQDKTVVIDRPTQTMAINTLEGAMQGRRDDYILQGVKGELYICRADVFEETFDRL